MVRERRSSVQKSRNAARSANGTECLHSNSSSHSGLILQWGREPVDKNLHHNNKTRGPFPYGVQRSVSLEPRPFSFSGMSSVWCLGPARRQPFFLSRSLRHIVFRRHTLAIYTSTHTHPINFECKHLVGRPLTALTWWTHSPPTLAVSN